MVHNQSLGLVLLTLSGWHVQRNSRGRVWQAVRFPSVSTYCHTRWGGKSSFLTSKHIVAVASSLWFVSYLKIEERLYEGGKYWACTEKTITATDSDSGMFMTLFRYITGANEGKKTISMTSPVSMKMTKHTDESFTKEMCFYLDSTYQSNPPQPENTNVYLLERPAMTIYTRWNRFKTFRVILFYTCYSNHPGK